MVLAFQIKSEFIEKKSTVPPQRTEMSDKCSIFDQLSSRVKLFRAFIGLSVFYSDIFHCQGTKPDILKVLKY